MPRSPITGKFKLAIIEINSEILAYQKTLHHRKRVLPKLSHLQLQKVFAAYKGLCAYCKAPLMLGDNFKLGGAHFSFEIPLVQGGEVAPSNVVPVCYAHKLRYNNLKSKRERVPDLDTFADLIEVLIESVSYEYKDIGKIRILKSEINSILEEIALHGHYKHYKEDLPKKPQHFINTNTVADIIEKMKTGEKTKEDLIESIKTITSTGQYRIKTAAPYGKKTPV